MNGLAIVPTKAAHPAAPRFSEDDLKPFGPTDVLSPASVNQFNECETRWMYKRVFGLPEKRNGSLALGSAVHEAIAVNFRQKIETKEDLPAEGAIAVFNGALSHELDTVELDKTESAAELRTCGEVMTRIYIDQCAPRIQPAAIELPVHGRIGNIPVQGFIDILDIHGNIIDVKTRKQKATKIEPSHYLQVATYTMLTPQASGRARLDTLTKTRTVALHEQTLEISQADRQYTERMYSLTHEKMQRGLYSPNRGSRLCSQRYCSFFERCIADYGGSVPK